MKRNAWFGYCTIVTSVLVLTGSWFAHAEAADSGPADPSAPVAQSAAATLPGCKHFSDIVPPDRSAGSDAKPGGAAPRISLDSRMPAPGNIRGSYSGGVVTFTFDRVPGAGGYRLWRNAQSAMWLTDWGQTMSISDPNPCRHATYTLVALANDPTASDASTGQLSGAYRLRDNGQVTSYKLAHQTKSNLITAYNDTGQTVSGYQAGPGKCAVDARYIPLGTRFWVDGYGWCYAADIGVWIQGRIIDVWLPGAEADNWGVQQRDITIE
jgi:3D (Asp-Asp-Asp) domain-containing protein